MTGDAIREIREELFTAQEEIIRLQSEAIGKLVTLLIQHADVDEADFAPAKERIDEAARIRAEKNL